jgi:hypothetical protein
LGALSICKEDVIVRNDRRKIDGIYIIELLVCSFTETVGLEKLLGEIVHIADQGCLK